MNGLCKARTNKGKQCKRKALPNEEYCKGHLYLKPGGVLKKTPFYKKPSFIIGTFLALFAIILTIYFGMRGPTKEEMPKIIGEAVQTKLEEKGISPPKTYEEIWKAIGKTCVQVGQAVCDKIKKASEDLDRGRYLQAEASYKTLIDLFPDVIELRFNLASAYYYQNKLSLAEKELREIIRIKPDFSEIHNNLGILLKKLKKFPEAEKEYRTAIKLNPDYADAHNNLGILLDELKNYPEAEKEYRTAIKLNPDYAAAHSNLGVQLKALKKYPEAEEEYRTAIKLNPDYAEAYGNLGLLYIEMGKKEGAKKELQKAKEFFEKQGKEEDVKKVEDILNDLG